MTEKTRSPEYRLAEGALSGLRQDLFRDAFAYRPLPPLSTDGALLRRLPGGRIRDAARWLPHATVLFLAFWTFLIAVASTPVNAPDLVISLVPAGAVVMTLIRPVGAWWVSLLSSPFVSVLTGSYSEWPWSPAGFLSHLTVMTVVALRTGPRAAGWMWALTAAYSVFADVVFSRGDYGSVAAPMLFISAVVLLTVSMFLIRRNADQEVAAQQTVTAVERDRRTLLEERTTIARELHDVVAHHMSVVAIQAEAAPYRVENPPEELEKAFATIRENAVAALTELRRILGVVRAEDYQAPDAPQPMLSDLDNLLANVREAGLETEKTITGAVRELPSGVELSAYRIIQEALSNALRHAPGATAKIEISYVLGGLGLRIVNTAPQGLVKPARRPTTAPHGGLRPHLSIGAGHGITGMRERVTMLSGEMTAEPTAEGGYEVTAFIPVAADRAAGPAGGTSQPAEETR
ncbi:histidine kinase [Streptomyces sp. NPDC005805]|uniref:sensor histidine kinase n=1 Tax=Streptomyces sp. NPDC005805 TaxID=3157068 RepID=UPI0033F13E50